MVLFTAGNLLSALADTYAAMLGGRIVAALCHGAFFGIGAVAAAGLVAPARTVQALALPPDPLTMRPRAWLETFRGQGLAGAGGDRPVPVR